MKLSARNQFKGKVVDIQEGAVNGIVKIDIGGGNVMSATISMNAIKELDLAVGKEAYAVVKATSVMVGSSLRMPILQMAVSSLPRSSARPATESSVRSSLRSKRPIPISSLWL